MERTAKRRFQALGWRAPDSIWYLSLIIWKPKLIKLQMTINKIQIISNSQYLNSKQKIKESPFYME